MKTTILLTVMLLTSSANAYDMERAQNNFHSDLVYCSEYFLFVADSITRHPTQTPQSAPSAKMYREKAEDLLKIALITSDDPELTVARKSLANKHIIKLIRGTYNNFSIVIDEFDEDCWATDKDPIARLQYWLDKD